MTKIKFCESCDKYTLSDKCPECGSDTYRKVPPNYSPEDKMGEYRRKGKKEKLKKEGLL